MKFKWLLICGAMLHLRGGFAQPWTGSPLYASAKTSRQAIIITGKVTDGNGQGIPGTSVSLKGTTLGTNTDTDGNFRLQIPEGTSSPTLVFSYVGYATQEIAVGSQTTINVQLKDDSRALSEVVVVGYGTQKRSDITGSVASVPKGRLSQLPVTNVLQAVQGSVAGVNISQPSSVPGASPSTTIRGQNSINANSGPFVVVDGIPLSKTGGSLNDINPNDIESMEILKDASAVAIYGTNGANGVILITTKRGTTGKPTIRYNNYVGIEEFSHILRPRNGAEYVQKYADFIAQTGQTAPFPVPNYDELPNYNAGITTDWIKESTQTGVLQDHNLSISGGSPNVRYFVSGEFLDQKGVVKGYNYKRASFRSNLDVTLTDFLTVGTSLFIANNNRDGGRANLLNASAMSPYGQMYNTNGTYKIFPMFPEQLYTNPLLGLTTDRLDRSTNLNGNGYVEVKLPGKLDGLKYRMNIGYSYIPARTGSYVGRAANDLIGTANTFFSETNSFTLENILSYTKDFGKHHFDFTGLYSAQQRKYGTASGEAKGFVNDQLSFNNLGAGATQSSNSYADRYALNSQMGRINYSYDSRYLLTVTARNDGSSVFGANTTKYGLFPSAALGWNISNEAFMKNQSLVNNLKLRFSYGKTGNEAISVYRTITTSNTGRSPFNGISTIGTFPGNLGNNNLQWETTLSQNLGVDFGLFNDRINGSLELYKNRTKGLLLLRSLPILTGYSSVFDNLGETSNTGVEVTLNTRNLTASDFKWETTLVFASNRNRIVDLYGDKKDDLGNRWFIGKPISVIYDYRMIGVWQQGESAADQDPGAVAGDLKFADINGDGKITPDGDRIILGQTAPKWTGGLTNTFHYKNLHLSVFIQTVQGITRNNADLTYADETGKRNTPIEVGYWTAENKSNTRPSLAYRNTRGYGYASDASFTRIKDVTLSYNLSQNLANKLGLGSLTVYASGRNLYTFTNWIGWDPEAVQSSRGSGDWTNNYPLTRSLVLGLNVSLR
ncbi:SusC/RagA family TonB-linked outer membrane protein [Siphonobacter curvatus]|uniref:SusC/RagA family TonB-linked outer membrane protein n=1 Tax=Siphonobacter curvatus TaxID=2094562 RepID=A0A2S7IJZ3_9BACT|nr:TonB-dependent receptor [Siphonobacter curvatus]PQA56921.1 SusC/RagA family TonB-linked outer membrane protein [Siphonobacter curvatus]